MKIQQEKSWEGLLMSLIITLTMFSACTQEGDLTGLNYDAVKELGNVYGNPYQPKVLINLQDGPQTSINDQELIDLIDPVDTDRVIVVNLHQWQTKNPISINGDTEPTDSDLQSWTNYSVDGLAEVIRHFKDQGKQVYVFGIGYGATLAQELLVRYGNDMADAYLLSGSRLKMDSDLANQLTLGYSGTYDYDATPASFIPSISATPETQKLNKLYGYLAQRDYESLLGGKDLSNVMYVVGDRDEVVGSLKASEQSILTQNNAAIRTISGGNHTDAIRTGLKESMELIFGI